MMDQNGHFTGENYELAYLLQVICCYLGLMLNKRQRFLRIQILGIAVPVGC